MGECCAHPGIEATRQCLVCGREFCGDCFSRVDPGICQFCISGYPIPERPANTSDSPKCQNAKVALILAVVGIFCCAVVLDPIALVLAFNAKKEIKAKPGIQGEGMATAAIWISVAGLALNLLGLLIFILAAIYGETPK